MLTFAALLRRCLGSVIQIVAAVASINKLSTMPTPHGGMQTVIRKGVVEDESLQLPMGQWWSWQGDVAFATSEGQEGLPFSVCGLFGDLPEIRKKKCLGGLCSLRAEELVPLEGEVLVCRNGE